MILYWIGLVVLFLCGARRRSHGSSDFLSHERTTAVNGFFIGWVFLRHVCDYLPGAGATVLDRAFGNVEFAFGQLIVATFLFFSGFGAMESIKSKGDAYVAAFPRKRILRVLLDFDIAVISFLIVGLLLGQSFDIRTVLLALTGWVSIGNSNWYIFIILSCWCVTYCVYAASLILRKDVVVSLVLLGLGVLFFYLKGSEFWWWDSLLAYPAGLIYSSCRKQIERVLQSHYALWFVVFLCLCVASRVLSKFAGSECPLRVPLLNIRTICFSMVVVMIMMKVDFGNVVSLWMGRHLFPIYIYQRLAMIVLAVAFGQGFIEGYRFVYVLSVAAVTAGIALAYEKWLHVRIR